jgi:hypothetical protein
MRSGLETTSIRNYGRWVAGSNWVEYALSRPMVDKSGGRMIYSAGTSHLMRNEGIGYQKEILRYMEERLVPFLAEF